MLRQSPAFVGHQGPRCLLLLSGVCYGSVVLKTPIPASVLLILLSLLTVSCNSATWHSRSPACAHLVQELNFSPGKGLGHMLQPTACTEISSSVWVDASDLSGAFAMIILVLTLWQVLTILAET